MKKIILCFCMFCTFLLVGCEDEIETSQPYKVYFIVENEEVLTLEFNDNFNMPYAPAVSGYTFEDWYLESNYLTVATVDNLSDHFIDNELKVYGKYNININDYRVNFISNDEVYSTLDFDSSETITLPTNPNGETRYDKFVGWYFDKECTEKLNYTTLYDTLKSYYTINLYAKFEEVDYYVDIEYIVGGTTYSNHTYHTSEKFSLPTNPTVEYNEQFLGWFIDENLTIKFDASKIKEYTSDKGNLKVYGSIGEQAKYTINFGLDFESINWYKNESIPSFPDANKANYKFLGWTYNGELINEDIYSYFVNSNEITLLPLYELLNINTIILDGNDSIQFYEDESYSLPSLTKENHIFKGWFLDKDLTIEYDLETNYFQDTNILYLYSKFEEHNKMIINFDTGTSLSLDSITIYNNNGSLSDVVLPTSSSLYRKFIGWKYNGEIIDLQEVYNLYEDNTEITLEAEYEFINYTINFYNGSEKIDTVEWIYPSEMISIEELNLKGYKFNGWYVGDVKVTNDNIMNFFNDIEINIYAKVEPIIYTFEFNVDIDGFIEPYTWTFDEEFILPIPFKLNYNFDYWIDYNKDIVNEETIYSIIDDQTVYLLTGVFTEAEHYTLTYLINGNETIVKWYKNEETPLLLNLSDGSDVFFHYFSNGYIITNENLLSFFEDDKLTIEAVFFNQLVDEIISYGDEQLKNWIDENLNNEIMDFLTSKLKSIFGEYFTQEDINGLYFGLLEIIINDINNVLVVDHYNSTLEFITKLTEQDFIDFYLYTESWLIEKVETIDLFLQELNIYLEENYINYFLSTYNDMINWIDENINIDKLNDIYSLLLEELKNYNENILIPMLGNLLESILTSDNFISVLPQVIDFILNNFDNDVLFMSVEYILKIAIEYGDYELLYTLVDVLFDYIIKSSNPELIVNLFKSLSSVVSTEVLLEYLTQYFEYLISDTENIDYTILYDILFNILDEEIAIQFIKTMLITLSENVSNETFIIIVKSLLIYMIEYNFDLAFNLIVWMFENLDSNTYVALTAFLLEIINDLPEEQQKIIKEYLGIPDIDIPTWPW